MSEPYNGIHDQGDWEPEVPMKFHIAYNPNYINKVPPGSQNYWHFNCSFKNGYGTLEQIANVVKHGHCITSPHHHIHNTNPDGKRTTYRVKANVIECQIAGFDFDTKDYRSSFEHILSYPLFDNYALLYTTASHTAEKPKARAFMPLSEPIPPEDMEIFLRSFLDKESGDLYGWADISCKDSSRLFYGSKDAEIRFPPNPCMSVEMAYDCYILPYKQELERREIEKEAKRQAFIARVGENHNLGSTKKQAKWLQKMIDNTVAKLADKSSGRHIALLGASSKISSYEKSPQIHTDCRYVFDGWKELLINACHANGYIDSYGEPSAVRAINDAEANSEPAFIDKQFIDVGDEVEVNAKGITGIVEGSKCWDNVWYYKVNGVYYPVDWVRLK